MLGKIKELLDRLRVRLETRGLRHGAAGIVSIGELAVKKEGDVVEDGGVGGRREESFPSPGGGFGR